MGGQIEMDVDSIYLGGGTPTVLEPAQLQRMFDAVRAQFSVRPQAEITVECAPGTLKPDMLDCLLHGGVNRVSLGVQSFVDAEAAAVGRLHKRAVVLDEIARLRAAGVSNINIDLIAGLPHQTAESWQSSLAETIATGAPHVSVYMLEVDEDSRLGRELIAGGTRYHAHFVPDEEAAADFYLMACDTLEAAGVMQYEISNFARPGSESHHNLKYWTRQPYLGFGVDAHSMLIANREGHDFSSEPALSDPEHCEGESKGAAMTTDQKLGFRPWGPAEAVRFSTADSLEKYLAPSALQQTVVSRTAAFEENFFLGLRLNRGVDLRRVATTFGRDALNNVRPVIAELAALELLHEDGDVIRLTSRGRLLSNEVFQRFLAPAAASTKA